MKNILYLTAIAGLGISAASAVDVTHYAANNCAGAARSCTNLARGGCCKASTRPFSSSRFTKLVDLDIGISYKASPSNTYCGTSVTTSCVNNLCLNGSFLSMKGSAWISVTQYCRVPSKRSLGDDGVTDAAREWFQEGQPGNCTISVSPDKLILESGHTFEIGPTTPEAHREELEEWADAHADFKDFPAHLLAYHLDHKDDTEPHHDHHGPTHP